MSSCVKCGISVMVDYRVKKPMCYKCFFDTSNEEYQSLNFPTVCIGYSHGNEEVSNFGSTKYECCSSDLTCVDNQNVKKDERLSEQDYEDMVSKLIEKHKIEIPFSQYKLFIELLEKGQDIESITQHFRSGAYKSLVD